MDFSFSLPVGFGDLEIPLKQMVTSIKASASNGSNLFSKYFSSNFLNHEKSDLVSDLAEMDSNAFINWDPQYLSKFYRGEKVRDQLGALPYSKEIIWSEKGNVRLRAFDDKFKFRYSDRVWREVAERGFHAISAERDIFDNGHVIRLFNVDRTTGDVDVQRALYSQQAQSNLIPDYVIPSKFDDNGSLSLRKQLQKKYGPILPPLNEARLANTLGISVIVLCHDDEGLLRPLLQLRTAKNAANNNSGVHCTGSRAALWPRDNQTKEAQNFFDDEAYEAVAKDFDLRQSEGEVSLYPAALVREHARMGKPQLFYYGYTPKSLDEVLKFRLEAQKEREINEAPDLEKYRSMNLDQFRKLILTDVWKDRDQYPITQEAYAMLWLLMDSFGKRYL
ncbi:hypothetical protein [Lentilitoribacter sp. EG35]|uniref:hypothetical protein n=1 Tax=Lentilitoribacter sp. EG35 TaxID=3234192 RepID=UPI00346128C1